MWGLYNKNNQSTVVKLCSVNIYFSDCTVKPLHLPYIILFIGTTPWCLATWALNDRHYTCCSAESYMYFKLCYYYLLQNQMVLKHCTRYPVCNIWHPRPSKKQAFIKSQVFLDICLFKWQLVSCTTNHLHAAGFGMGFLILVHELLQRRIPRQVRVLQRANSVSSEAGGSFGLERVKSLLD